MRNAAYMPRRTFLKAALAGSAISVGATAAQASDEVEICVTFDEEKEAAHTETTISPTSSADIAETKIGEITGTGDPVDINGEYVSEVFMTGPDRFDYNLWRGVATVGPHNRDRGRIWLSDAFYTETARLLAHERGHNLGFRHTGGFMAATDPDMDPDVPLHQETVETVVNTDGLFLCEWENEEASEDVFRLIDGWRAEKVSSDDVFYAIDRWREGESRDVYADSTFIKPLTDGLQEYDDEPRRLRSNAIYRPENGARFEPWG